VIVSLGYVRFWITRTNAQCSNPAQNVGVCLRFCVSCSLLLFSYWSYGRPIPSLRSHTKSYKELCFKNSAVDQAPTDTAARGAMWCGGPPHVQNSKIYSLFFFFGGVFLSSDRKSSILEPWCEIFDLVAETL
jgi:hypothetical protein